ncbi:MAG: hypothetical protein ACOYNL_03250 [Rickettsiales bacterium]
MTDDIAQAAKAQLVVAKNESLERQYAGDTIPYAAYGNARIACMNGSAASSRVVRDGQVLNPAKLCMAVMEQTAEFEIKSDYTGNMTLMPYKELAEMKGYAQTNNNANALVSGINTLIDQNASNVGPLVLNLPNGQTLGVGVARAYDVGFTLGFDRLSKGDQLPPTKLEQKSQQELENYVLGCIKNNSLNFGTCKAVGLEHVRRVVTPIPAKQSYASTRQQRD